MASHDILIEDLSSSSSSASLSMSNCNEKEYKFEILWSVHKQAMRLVHGLSDRRRCLRGLSCVEYFFSMESNIDEKSSRFKIYLNLIFPDNKTIAADYHIRVPSAGYSKRCHHFFSKSAKKGDEVFHRNHVFETRNKYIDIAAVNIKIDGIFKVKDSSSNIPFFFQSDYSIHVDGQKIQVHKSIMQQHLPHFYSTFDLPRSKHRVTNYSFMVIKAACGFCYSQPFPAPLFSGTLIELIKFAEEYKNEKLKTMTESALCKKITVSNVIELANLTETYELPKLRKQALEYLASSHFDEETMDFKSLNNSLKLEMAKMKEK